MLSVCLFAHFASCKIDIRINFIFNRIINIKKILNLLRSINFRRIYERISINYYNSSFIAITLELKRLFNSN